MLIDVNSPLAGESIDRGAPSTSYDVSYLNRTFGVVEAFKNYPNTLLFFSGNEVINDVPTAGTVPPYMRASPSLPSHLPTSDIYRPSHAILRTTLQSTQLAASPSVTAPQTFERSFSILGIIFNVLRLATTPIPHASICLL